MSASINPPRVLISYSLDSPDHAKRVLDLSDRLRGDGVDCRLDQYVPNPQQGWPLWMDLEVEEANFVLMVFTERYTTRSLEPRKSGVRFESVLILNELYESGMINDKFIPVLFDRAHEQYIHKWLRYYSFYVVDSSEGYESLRRRLLYDPAVVMPPLGTPVLLGPRKPVLPPQTHVITSIETSPARTAPNLYTDHRFRLFDDLCRAIDNETLSSTKGLAKIIRDACRRPAEMRTSETYSFSRVDDVIAIEDERLDDIDAGATVEDWRRDYWQVVASVAIAVVQETKVSGAVGDWLVEISRGLFRKEDYEPMMSEEQRTRFYDVANDVVTGKAIPEDLLVYLNSIEIRRRTTK